MKDLLNMPLPAEKLKKRYAKAFNAFNAGSSVSIIGLPLSGRSVFFRSIIEVNKRLLEDLLDNRETQFVFIDHYKGEKYADRFKLFIATQFLEIKGIKKNLKERFITAIQSNNSDLAFKLLDNIIKQLHTNYRIITVIFGIEDYAANAPQLIPIIYDLYIMKWQTENSFSFCFPNGPTILNHKNLIPIQSVIQEKIVYLPLLDTDELNYTRRRFEKMGYCKIKDKTHKKISELSGGHYMLYKSISKAYSNEQIETDVDSIKSNPQIHSILERIYQSALEFADNKENILKNGILEKIGLTKNGEFSIPLLPIEMKKSKTKNNLVATDGEKDIRPNLTPQELLIFDFLHGNLTKIKTKEELAKLIWGKNWPNKYSEQAIDKTISRLRSKLKDSRFQLTSIRNRGIRLVKI